MDKCTVCLRIQYNGLFKKQKELNEGQVKVYTNSITSRNRLIKVQILATKGKYTVFTIM